MRNKSVETQNFASLHDINYKSRKGVIMFNRKKAFILKLFFSFLFFISFSIYAENEEERIGYIYYDNMAPVYQFDYTISNTIGDVFVDHNNILHVINQKGSFEFDTTGKLMVHKNELEQIPIKIDNENNIFIREKNIIKKLNNVGKLAYTIDITPGEEFIFIDKKEQFYFITRRDIYEDLSYEKENLLKEIEELLKEREELDTRDSPYYRDFDYNKRQYKDNEQRMMELDWELKKLVDYYEHLWKSNINSTNPISQNDMNIRFEDLKRKKQDYYDYRVQQYDLRKKQESLDSDVKDKKYDLLKREKDTRLKLKELDAQIKKDIERKYIIKIIDNQEQIVKRIPIVTSTKSVPLWECVNIIVDNDNNYYGIYKDRIYVFDEESNPICSFGRYGTHKGEIIKASQIAVDTKKSIYVVDTMNNCIVKFRIK